MNKIGYFIAGATVGALTTYIVLKTKYEREYYEEIEEDEYEDEGFEEQETPDPMFNVKPDLSEFAAKLAQNGYTQSEETEDEEPEEEEEEAYMSDKPYIISPDDFDELDDYDAASLTYYADGILTDEDDNIIEDVDDIVGEDSLHAFGEFEEDAVYVRNDTLKCDYEILRVDDVYDPPVEEE